MIKIKSAIGAPDITVTKNVPATGVEPIGANLTTIAGGTNFAVNTHAWNSGFEPMAMGNVSDPAFNG
jgi:hypothetical protein